jgi:hypothetical protein
MNEFKISEYISLKLEEEIIVEEGNLKELRTNIYVRGEKFRQCSFLLIEIPISKITLLDNIESIDEAEEKLDSSLEEDNDNPFKYKIPPETEFWGHCSNIQVWVENDYNTRLLHRNLAFPLLKKLTEVNDLKAKGIFKEEIAERFASCHLPVIHFLLFENYLDYLSEEELDVLLSDLKSRNKLLYLYLEPVFMIKGYIHHNLNKKEFKQYLSKFYSDIEAGKFQKLKTYENFNLDHSYIIRNFFYRGKQKNI